eukprot:scaffold3243_cov47-Attheya_sp.AAC.7
MVKQQQPPSSRRASGLVLVGVMLLAKSCSAFSLRSTALLRQSPAAFATISIQSSNRPTIHHTSYRTQSSLAVASQQNNSVQGKTEKKKVTVNHNTGGLRRLPIIKRPIELVDRSKKVAKQIRADPAIKNARNRARKHGAETMDAITKALCIPLRDCVKGYRTELRRLHPFEKVVADLTARARQKKDGLVLMDVLDEIHEARKELLLAGKDWTARAKTAETAREVMDAMRQGEDRMYEIFSDLAAKPVSDVIELQKSLRVVPSIRLDTPAVVLVGAPNVGKSSIVRAISSATPEVNNYPFTTRGMTLGHVEVFWSDDATTAAAVIPTAGSGGRHRSSVNEYEGSYAFSQLCQVMDSPGLLVRPDNERNEMESLTLAAMQHLPTAVMYVMDLSGGAGDRCSSIQDQLQLRKEVRSRFPRRPWIDVVSKIDLDVEDGALEALDEIMDGTPYLKLSIIEGTGVEELSQEVMRMLGEVRVVLDAMAAVDERSARSEKPPKVNV